MLANTREHAIDSLSNAQNGNDNRMICHFDDAITSKIENFTRRIHAFACSDWSRVAVISRVVGWRTPFRQHIVNKKLIAFLTDWQIFGHFINCIRRMFAICMLACYVLYQYWSMVNVVDLMWHTHTHTQVTFGRFHQLRLRSTEK